jgi:hypothetical protein
MAQRNLAGGLACSSNAPWAVWSSPTSRIAIALDKSKSNRARAAAANVRPKSRASPSRGSAGVLRGEGPQERVRRLFTEDENNDEDMARGVLMWWIWSRRSKWSQLEQYGGSKAVDLCSMFNVCYFSLIVEMHICF